MKASWTMLLLGATVGGVVGALVTRALWPTLPSAGEHALGPAALDRDSSAASEQGDGLEQDDATSARLATLEHRISLLNAALLRRSAGGTAEDPKGSAETESGSALEGSKATDVADPVFEAAVLDILDRERERKDVEDSSSRKQQQSDRGRRYAVELSETLGLDNHQQQEVARVVTEYFEQMRVMNDESQPDWAATRKERRAARERVSQTAEQQLKTILSGEQYSRYQALDADEQLAWSRRRRDPSGTGSPNPSPASSGLPTGGRN